MDDIFGTWYCPNPECTNKNTIKNGEKCPSCGSNAKNFTPADTIKLFTVKDEHRDWFCPNTTCTNFERLVKNEKCGLCGTKSQLFNPEGLNKLRNLKKSSLHNAAIEEAAKNPPGKLLVTDKMTESEIKLLMYDDMRNLAAHEAGSAWMRLGTLLSFNSTEQMLGAGFKALIDQNKIIIRQNELILRQLSLFNKQGSKSDHS